MKLLKVLVVMLMLLIVSACGAHLSEKAYYSLQRESAKNRSAYKQFQELCDSEDRVSVDEIAVVDGYALLGMNMCDISWDELFDPGYKYYECQKVNSSKFGSDKEASIYIH